MEHSNLYEPALSAGTSYVFVATPGKSLPSNTFLPVESRMSMSWFVPASWFSNVILNGAPAGASSFVTLNFTSLALTVSTPGGGPPDPGAPDAAGDPPGAGEPLAVSPLADFGGNQPWVNTTPTSNRRPIAQNSRLGHAGAGSFTT